MQSEEGDRRRESEGKKAVRKDSRLKPQPPVIEKEQAMVDARHMDPSGEYETPHHAQQIQRKKEDERRNPPAGGPDWDPGIDAVDEAPDKL